MQIIIFPDGQRVFVSYIKNYQVIGTVLSINTTDGKVINYSIQGDVNTLLTALDSFITSNSTSFTITDNAALSITNVVRQSDGSNIFDIATDIVLITGTGFINAGNLYFDDKAGGKDFNGYYMTCTLIDSSHMTAIYGGAGDGILNDPDNQVLITFLDSVTAIQSNSLTGSNITGTLVSYP